MGIELKGWQERETIGSDDVRAARWRAEGILIKRQAEQ
jgi:hypothetical protein